VNSSPPAQVAIMIERLKTLDCSEVATSAASSTRWMTAAWYIVTSGPNASPQRKKAAWETTGVPLGRRGRAGDSIVRRRGAGAEFRIDGWGPAGKPTHRITLSADRALARS